MRTYPKQTSNRNVPSNSFLIAEVSQMSGEIIQTFYADCDGNLFKVVDWKGCKPSPAFMFEICRLTGDTPNIVQSKLEGHFQRD